LRGPIVLASRGSGDAPAAISIAQSVARKLNRNLAVVSVVEPALLYGLPPELQTSAVTFDEEARKAREADVTKGAFAKAIEPGVAWSAEVRMGQPALEVCDAAASLDATLIVVGASPHRRLRRIVAGQRAAQILHRAASPVLSVAPWLRELPHNVVAAIDFSVASLNAAQTALLLTGKGARFTLVHVMPPDLVFPVPAEKGNVLRTSIRSELEKIATMLKELAPEQTSVECVVLGGDAAAELLNYSEKHDADLLVLGTQGGSILRRALVGSVATEVFHTALCSVLASPPPPFSSKLEMDLKMRGTASAAEPREFASLLDSFNSRNSGRSVSLEEDDPIIGAQVQVEGYRLRGVTWDNADRRVDVMLGAPDGENHLTRSIPDVSAVSVAADPDGNDTALQIKHARAQTLLLLHRKA
jgi:nucleotide-binding universal stress UspA family protein